MEPIFFPDYKHSILNVTTSILKYYGCDIKHPSLALLDQALKHKVNNVVYVLIDALGLEILNKHPNACLNLKKDLLGSVSSVFPPTTVAATTSVLTGLSPVETGWLGWSQYIKEEKKSVIFFLNRDYYDDNTIFDYDVAGKYVPVRKIYEQIIACNPDVECREVFPEFREPRHDTFLKQTETILDIINKPGKHFIYCYWDKLDTLMHEFGPDSEEARDMVRSIDAGYGNLVEKLPKSSLVVLIADHGQIGVQPIHLRSYPDLWDTFSHSPSLDSRATAFFIKPDRKDEFEQLFNTYFRDKYVLYKSRDVLEMNLFGEGPKHPKIEEFLGDYVGIAVDHFYFKLTTDDFVMKGQHAGLLAEESFVPLIFHEKR